MKESRKKLFSYAIIMLIAAILIILISYMSESRVDEYQNQLTASQNEAENIQNEMLNSKEKILELEKENKKNMTAASDFETYKQSLNGLTEVWNTAQYGDIDKAKQMFSQIDRSTLDDTGCAFYDAVSSWLTDK